MQSGHGITREASTQEEPPEYTRHDQLLSGTADATDDGRIAVDLDSKVSQVLARLIDVKDIQDPPPAYDPGSQPTWTIPLSIVIHVVGSRGDVQPFVALGKELQKCGHRVRLATHDAFKSFVQETGLEFFPIGGDPAELMAYMVKNPGLIPGIQTLREGEIKRKRKMIAQMLHGCWKSCISPDPDTMVPFVANAIIANPPSFAHTHCAQALAVPLHLMFTMPWSPTRAFPHPLANVKNSKTDPKLANYLSYGFVQALTWQGIGDLINDFRSTLGLLEAPISEGPFLAETLQIPYTYCWSPALVPRPLDWPAYIDVCGFMFREPPNYQPTVELATFLAAGDTPVYIGFGSIVVKHPDALLAIVLEAVKLSGVRAIISKGWSELSSADATKDVLFLGDCPHEWLFQHVAAVVHHGGAGTTAAGLACGKPTVVVPFFGDQPFWGDMVYASGAGPRPIPHRELQAENLAKAITFCLTPEANAAAGGLATRVNADTGAETAVAAFHRQISAEAIRCDLVPTLPAVYAHSRKKLKLSSQAANALVKAGNIKVKELSLHKAKIIHIENRRWDPVTSGFSAGLGVALDILKAGNNLWYGPYRVRQETRDAVAIVSAEGSTSTTTLSPEQQTREAAKMAGASLTTIPRLFGVILKGCVLDAPLAVTEGLKATPRLYGEKVEEHRPVADWKSGFEVASKDSSKLLASGVVDVFVQPYRGAKEAGALGFATGIVRGLSGTATKTAAGAAGLVAYPLQGIYKSLHAVTHSQTEREVLKAVEKRDHYFIGAQEPVLSDEEIVAAFQDLTTKR